MQQHNFYLSTTTMAPHNFSWNICNDCGGDRLVTTREGDFVCTQCGLVKEERCIDDTAHAFEDIHWEPIVDDEAIKQARILKDLRLNDLDDIIKDVICRFHTLAIESGRKQFDTSFWAACVYMASMELNRGMSPEECMRLLGCEESHKFWESYKQLGGKTIPQARHNNGLARVIHVLDLPSDKIWEIKKIADRLWERVKDDVGTLKSSKLNSSIVYIACKIGGINNLHNVCSKLNISKGTLKKHEERIQSILARKHAT